MVLGFEVAFQLAGNVGMSSQELAPRAHRSRVDQRFLFHCLLVHRHVDQSTSAVWERARTRQGCQMIDNLTDSARLTASASPLDSRARPVEDHGRPGWASVLVGAPPAAARPVPAPPAPEAARFGPRRTRPGWTYGYGGRAGV